MHLRGPGPPARQDEKLIFGAFIGMSDRPTHLIGHDEIAQQNQNDVGGHRSPAPLGYGESANRCCAGIDDCSHGYEYIGDDGMDNRRWEAGSSFIDTILLEIMSESREHAGDIRCRHS